MTSEMMIGRTIAGKYRVESLVGQGAMGCVYRVKQTQLGTTLALKVLHRPLANDAMFAARFLREAQAASRVDHPNSMRVVDFGEEPDGNLYIAMEYVDGKTLGRIIEEESPLAVWRIVDIASQALAALAVAHDLGVVHRDLKPENIMVVWGEDDEGRTHDLVKVCDFGVAKLLEGSRGPNVTAEGLVVGTPEYMSPEQARGETLDARSDVYAMGVLLFQLMTGKVPFDSSTAFGTALMHVNDEPTQPHLLNPGVDKRLERICLKAMRKRPADRHSSARELRGELRALLEHEDEEVVMNERQTLNERKKKRMSEFEGDVPAGLLAQIESRPRRSGWAVSGVVIASVIAGGMYLRHRGAVPDDRRPPVALQEPVQSATLTAAPLPKPAETAAPAPVASAAPTTTGADEEKPASHAAHPHVAHGSARHGTSKTPRGSIAIGEEPAAEAPKTSKKEPAPKAEPTPVTSAAPPAAPKAQAGPASPPPPKADPAPVVPKADAPRTAPAEAPLPDFPVPKAEAPAKPANPPPALPPLEP